MAYIIRTSDRLQFKKCRRAWDIGSKIRQNLEPIALRRNLDFGSAIHAGLEVWYDPKMWRADRQVIEVLMISTFQEKLNKLFEQYKRRAGIAVLSEEDLNMYHELSTLGDGMLRGFAKWAIGADVGLTPVYVEIEFEVPIPDVASLDWLIIKGAPVVYQGRIDLIVRDHEGRYWIVDHKTTNRLDEDMSFLELDEQMKSYAWAVQRMLGIKIHGIIYQELYKGVPEPPKELASVRKGCRFSTSKSQDTSYDVFLATVMKEDTLALESGYYDDYLEFLKYEGKQYFRRTRHMYNQHELEALGNQICLEAIDMLNAPSIYPNPNKFGCKFCDHQRLCLAMNDGSDVNYIKQNNYFVRTSD